MKIQIAGEYRYNKFPITNEALTLELSQEDLAKIGISHKFNTQALSIVPMTSEDIAQANQRKAQHERMVKIIELKRQLSSLDYKTSKYADGEYTATEWATVVAERNAIRMQIRQLEGV